MNSSSSIAAPQPSNVESEYVLIAGMLFNSRTIDAVADTLEARDFADPFFGRMFSVIIASHAGGQTLNAFSIKPHIERDPSYEEMGGQAFLAGITSSATLADPRLAARQIADLAKRRRLISSLSEAIAECQDVGGGMDSIVSIVDSGVGDATSTSAATVEVSGAQAMARLLNNAGADKKSVRSGTIGCLDDLIGGMRPSQVVIGAGRPGMGKTAAALSYSIGAAKRGHGVMFVSMEMGAEELAARIAADMAYDGPNRVAFGDINSDNPSQRAKAAIAEAMAELDNLPFHIIDAGSLTVGRLDMLVRRYKRKLAAQGKSLDLIVVDYLQLLRTDEKLKSNYESVSEVSRRLKAMAKDHEVAVFALAQLSREVEKRDDKRPHLSDLRDSGQIEQDADAVVFFYRLEYYLKLAMPDPGSAKYADAEATLSAVEGQIEFICAKRRNGVTGSAGGEFHGQYQAVRG